MRIGVIGLGSVGTSVAVSTLHMGVATRLLLQDADRARAEGEAMDLAHGAAFYPTAEVRLADLDEMRACDAIVIAAGKKGKPGESRLALLRDNARMAREIGACLAGFAGIVVVVTNPVDVLVRIVAESSGLPVTRVIGTGTMLDTARLRHAIGRELRVDPRSVHAQVVGEHGDSEVVLWSGAQVGGVSLRDYARWAKDGEAALAHEVRHAAYEIIAKKGATNHAIGLVTAALLRWVLRGERRVLTVSRVQEGACGLRGVALSLPTIVGREGAVEVLEPTMDAGERSALEASGEVLAKAYADVAGG